MRGRWRLLLAEEEEEEEQEQEEEEQLQQEEKEKEKEQTASSLSHMFQVWRAVGGRGPGRGRPPGWGRDHEAPGIPGPDCPVWVLLCRGGRARLREACQRGRGVIKLPAHMQGVTLPRLFDIHQVPQVFREDSIVSGYRPPHSSVMDCVLSSFQMTNETVNIWSHFLPAWYFLWRLCVLGSRLDVLGDSYSWPLLVHMLLVCVFLFTSSCAHTFSTMSPESRHVCYFLDYGALSLYSLGCAVSYRHYVMPDSWIQSWIHQHFVTIAIGNSVLCTSLSCYSRFVELQRPQTSKVVRTAAFIIPFLFDTGPLFYRVWSRAGSGSESLSSHCYHLLFAVLTCFLFTAHLPERLAPGRFDFFGHSHQLFHVSAVMGTHFQVEGVMADMASRRSFLLGRGAAPSFLDTVAAPLVGLLLNLAVIAAFSTPLLRSAAAPSKEQ